MSTAITPRHAAVMSTGSPTWQGFPTRRARPNDHRTARENGESTKQDGPQAIAPTIVTPEGLATLLRRARD